MKKIFRNIGRILASQILIHFVANKIFFKIANENVIVG